MMKIDFTKPIVEKVSSKENESVGYSSTVRERKLSQPVSVNYLVCIALE